MKLSYQQQSNIYKGGLRGVGLSSWARNKRWLSKCEGCWNKFGKMVVLWSFVKNVPSGTFQCLFLVTSVWKKFPFNTNICRFFGAGRILLGWGAILWCGVWRNMWLVVRICLLLQISTCFLVVFLPELFCISSWSFWDNLIFKI